MADVPEQAQKRLHILCFTVKWLVIGLLLFFVAQLAFQMFLVQPDAEAGLEVDMLWHSYCGTFFVENTVENTYASQEAYDIYQSIASDRSGVGAKVDFLVTNVGLPLILLFLFFALRNAEKRQLLTRHTARWLLLSGTLWSAVGIYGQVQKYMALRQELPYLTGVPGTARFYCQLYNALGIPALVLLCALLLRQSEMSLRGKSTAGNGRLLKGYAGMLALGMFGFLLYRFSVRVYELELCFGGSAHNARLPFYAQTWELPRGLAVSSQAYTELLLFRFLKDLPVFAASAFTGVMLIRILLSAAKNEVNTKENVCRFTRSIGVLFLSSLLFNGMGLYEVHLLNENFTGIYGNVTYTIGIRALCEPALYALVLWFVLTFVRAVPQYGRENTSGES